MKRLFLFAAALLGSFILAPAASAQVTGACTYTEANGTTKNCIVTEQFTSLNSTPTTYTTAITTGGTSQLVFNANTQRSWLWCQNPPSATESLFINLGTTASTVSGSIELAAGQTFVMDSAAIFTGIVYATAATSGHAFICKQA